MLQNQITIPDELRSVAKYAFNGVSWSPGKRAESVLNEYQVVLSEMQAQIKALAGENADAEFERFSAKYTQLVINWLHAKSRCISSAVTGPSNFPVRRAEKANNAEQNRMEEMINFREKVLKVLRSVKMRIAELEKKAQQETTEKTVSGVRVVENTDEDRIQLFFPCKPEYNVRSMLKSKGFRWSGKNGCWQCYLNQHGKWRTEQVLEQLSN